MASSLCTAKFKAALLSERKMHFSIHCNYFLKLQFITAEHYETNKYECCQKHYTKLCFLTPSGISITYAFETQHFSSAAVLHGSQNRV